MNEEEKNLTAKRIIWLQLSHSMKLTKLKHEAQEKDDQRDEEAMALRRQIFHEREQHKRDLKLVVISAHGMKISTATSPPVGKSNKRSNELKAPIEEARALALNADDPESVWIAFVGLANSGNPKKNPLMEGCAREGVKWNTGDIDDHGNNVISILSKAAFKKRLKRR